VPHGIVAHAFLPVLIVERFFHGDPKGARLLPAKYGSAYPWGAYLAPGNKRDTMSRNWPLSNRHD
jgi:hypothetical protein